MVSPASKSSSICVLHTPFSLTTIQHNNKSHSILGLPFWGSLLCFAPVKLC